MKRLALAAALLFATPALAQQPPPQIDPRLSGPMVEALQAQVGFQQAVIKAMQEDKGKKDADLAAWFKGWFGDKPVAETK
jgi:hypothetical protein